jgi:UDP-3-O-[3-hydroxymyristoyl] N-acetylglucosamine deacetylase
MLKQRTLLSSTQAVGVGLHSGERVTITLAPAPINTGIVFRRTDIEGAVPIPVTADSVTDTRMASTISSVNAKVQTIEHLMSAAAGLGIDNLFVDLSAEEVPIFDGSAASFVFLMQSAGITEQAAARRFVKVTQPIEVRQGSGDQLKWARLDPLHGYSLKFEIDFNHPAVDGTEQAVFFDYASGRYAHDIGRARTFGFTKDVEMLRGNGLALGGGLDNAIVMDDDKILNAEGLRYDAEFARHKILDAMGDLYVLGSPLLAAYSAFRSGHAMNNQLLRALIDAPHAWNYVTFENSADAPTGFSKLPTAW